MKILKEGMRVIGGSGDWNVGPVIGDWNVTRGVKT